MCLMYSKFVEHIKRHENHPNALKHRRNRLRSFNALKHVSHSLKSEKQQMQIDLKPWKSSKNQPYSNYRTGSSKLIEIS